MAKESRVVTIGDEQEQGAALPVNESTAKVIAGANFDDQLCGDKVKLEISEGEGDGGKEAVFLQLNGYAYQIPRGVEVIVPVEVLGILNNSKMTVYSTAQGGGQSEREVKRFNFSVLETIKKAA